MDDAWATDGESDGDADGVHGDEEERKTAVPFAHWRVKSVRRGA